MPLPLASNQVKSPTRLATEKLVTAADCGGVWLFVAVTVLTNCVATSGTFSVACSRTLTLVPAGRT